MILPFEERPVIELLRLDRDDPDPDFDGYGWAKLDRLWLRGEHGPARRVDDALIVAAHAADDGVPLADDIELDFPMGGIVARTTASAFLAEQLPRLPAASNVVLAMCNPHRAVVALPPTLAVIHAPGGDVRAWLDPGDRIRLTAEAWRTLRGVSTDLTRRPGTAISDEDRQTYAALYVLKKMDLKPAEGGMTFPVVLPSELSPIDDVLQQLAVDDLVAINQKKGIYELTKQGIAYLGENIDEASDLVDEFDDAELEEVVAELRRRNLDPFRARFLWGWFDGEFDDLVLYQERRGVRPVERMWAFYLMGDDFWRDLARELE